MFTLKAPDNQRDAPESRIIQLPSARFTCIEYLQHKTQLIAEVYVKMKTQNFLSSLLIIVEVV